MEYDPVFSDSLTTGDGNPLIIRDVLSCIQARRLGSNVAGEGRLFDTCLSNPKTDVPDNSALQV
jgi:hypothetical protein